MGIPSAALSPSWHSGASGARPIVSCCQYQYTYRRFHHTPPSVRCTVVGTLSLCCALRAGSCKALHEHLTQVRPALLHAPDPLAHRTVRPIIAPSADM